MKEPTQEALDLEASKPQRTRLIEILQRFVAGSDAELSDRDFVYAVIERFRKQRDEPVLDPNA